MLWLHKENMGIIYFRIPNGHTTTIKKEDVQP